MEHEDEMSQPDLHKHGWDPPLQRPDQALHAKIYVLSKLLPVLSKNEGSHLDSYAHMIVRGKHCHTLS